MTKKRIALVPLWDSKMDSLWMRPTYLNAVRDSGGIPVILPLHISAEDAVQILSVCDGLLITGGQDVAPSAYGQEKKDTCGELCEARDALEAALYRYASQQDLPVLGICRGIQTINVLEGGTLYQDLPTEHPSELDHQCKTSDDPDMHQVALHSALGDLLGTDRLGVNSYHHQAIQKLADSLEILATADDGIVEGVRHKHRRFVWAVQWHPERSFERDENSRKLIKAFVDAC